MDADADSDGIADCNDDLMVASACNCDANSTIAFVFVTSPSTAMGVDLNTNGTCDLEEGESSRSQDATACNYHSGEACLI